MTTRKATAKNTTEDEAQQDAEEAVQAGEEQREEEKEAERERVEKATVSGEVTEDGKPLPLGVPSVSEPVPYEEPKEDTPVEGDLKVAPWVDPNTYPEDSEDPPRHP